MRPKYRFDLKKCLTNLIPILKLCVIVLTKIIFVFLIHKNKYFIWLHIVQLSLIEPADWWPVHHSPWLTRLAWVGRLLVVNHKDNYFFLIKKIIHNFKIGFKFVKHFLNQTYILAVFNEALSKVILNSTTQINKCIMCV